MLDQRDKDSTGLDPEECGCAPSEQERRALWPNFVSRRTALALGVMGLAAVGVAAAPRLEPAFAADYPSWPDVQKAMASESSKKAEISKIQGLIAGLQSQAAAAQALAQKRGEEFYAAQQAAFDAAERADSLQSQADKQAGVAKDAADKAGRVAAQLYRDGGDDTSLQLFLSGSAAGADDLLARLGTMDKLLEANNAVYADAVAARDLARSLSDQAVAQRDERDRLQKVAEKKMVAAQEASDAADAAVAASESHRVELEAQLAALHETTVKTVAEYKAGVEARRKAEEARKKREAERARQAAIARQKAAEEAARREAAARKKAAARPASSGGGSSSGGGGSSSGGGGTVRGSGWARPSSGRQSSGYGPRTVQCGASYCSSGFHYGVDLASWCGSPIYAAHAGRVVYAGYNGGYGNYIKIDHGGGIGSGYGHIMPGGIHVRVGQHVRAGQRIASEGNTGNSFGCHCHFEIYRNGYPINPIPFMAARGISV